VTRKEIFDYIEQIYMIPFEEEFKPSLQYRPYLAIITIGSIIFIWLACAGWTYFEIEEEGLLAFIPLIATVLLVAALAFSLLWVVLYYQSITYYLNKTEMTWKRGVWFRKTGIVPYNRITNVDIVQGPLMRLFHISDLKIQTAGVSADGTAEITMVGMEKPEPLRSLIMGFVRGQPSVAAVTGAENADIPHYTNSDMAALLEEVSKIRKILESKQ
jgi:membrane protein YdbS with pleckstrin-like domain